MIPSIIILLHGETFYINFYYSIFQFREKRITLRIFVSKNLYKKLLRVFMKAKLCIFAWGLIFMNKLPQP